MTNNILAGGCAQCCPPRCNPCIPPCPPQPGMGPTGPAGPAGPEGATGATGPQGERGPIASLIPFSVDSVTAEGDSIGTNEQGIPEVINFAGFGGSTYYAIHLAPGDWESGTITFTDGMSYGASFIMPYDGTLRSISVVFANRMLGSIISDGAIMRPFVCLATMPAGAAQLAYNILPETMTFTQPYIGTGEPIPKYTLRWGAQEGLSTVLAKGTAVAIVLGWMGENVTEPQYINVSISGGLFID